MTIAALFQLLVLTWHIDAAGEKVEALAADVAARVGAAGCSVCVGLFRTECIHSLVGVAAFLDSYGITLRRSVRNSRVDALVYAQVAPDKPSEFQGARVRAVRVKDQQPSP